MSEEHPEGRSEGNTTSIVLLVEDSVDDVLLTRRAFRKAGIESLLRVCSDGEEAVQYLAAQPPFSDRGRHPLPVLVLLDWKLPRRNGLEVLEWIREQGATKELPVIVVSSSGQQDEIDLAIAAGATSYVQKPLQLKSLLELLDGLDVPLLKPRTIE